MTTTPAGNEPHRPGGPLAPTAPGNAPTATLQPLTRTQKILTGIVVGAVLVIATLGFIGSYTAVTDLAKAKDFGEFAHAFPIAVDAGIIAFLALDLLLTWRRIAFPLLRYTAWGLTTATISFNAVAAWPDPVGVSMHGVIPILFVIAVEAARHAVGRIAEITADKHLEGPNASRWLLNPLGTFILWRRQRLWGIRTWDTVLGLEQERRIFKGKLRKEYGRGWRRTAPADQLLILRLATKDGLSITEAIALPEKEAAKQRAEQQRLADEKRAAEDQRRRDEEAYRREQKRLDEEAANKAEAERIENERQAVALQKEKAEAERERIVADAKAQAELADIARREQQAQAELDRQQREANEAAARRQREEQAEADRRARQEQLEHARLLDEEKRKADEAAAQAARDKRQQEIEDARRLAAEQERAAEAARQRRENAEAAAHAAAEKEAASRRALEIVQRASANTAPASRPASATSASRTIASQPANAATNPAASRPAGSASATSANPASPAATSGQAANASTNQAPATNAGGSANDDYIQKVVDVYQLLEQQEGKAPSDARLGQALGVSRSRAQQMRTAAIEAGHTELAKPMRLAS